MQVEHPGKILASFLRPLHISAYRVAKETGIPQTRLSQIMMGKRSITPDTALRLSKYLGLDETFWIQAQVSYDIAKTKDLIAKDLEAIKPFSPED